ncbi:MAG: type II secretion system F family protein [Pirellulaceae bacterium]
MENYRYQATNEQGAETAGVVEASSVEAAVQMLRDRGFREIRVFASPTEGADQSRRPPVSLNGGEAGELSRHVARVSTARLPLAAGLRAAADETVNSRVATALLWIADQIEQGSSLEEALTDSGKLLPPHISGLMLAAARAGNMGEALFELVELQQRTFTLRRDVSSRYVYPLVVVILASVILIVPIYFTVGSLQEMMYGFSLELPLATRVLFWWRNTGLWLVGGFGLLLACLAAAYRRIAGPVRWRRLLSTFPLFGLLGHWIAIAEWCGVLSVLLRHDMPLPDSLRCAGRGVVDAHVGSLSFRLAEGVVRGRSLSQMVSAIPQMPSSIVPVIEWGEKSGDLADSFQMGQQMFDRRARLRAAMLESVLPPILFIGIGSVILFVLPALFFPLTSLVSALK